jgi:glycosyltransferase involved in cell wall biosynthesis
MKKIEFCAFLNRSGYATASQDYIYALLNSGKYDISLFLVNGSIERLTCSPERYQQLNALSQKRQKSDVQFIHCIPEMQRRVRRNGKTVGFATYETTDPPPVWIQFLNRNDAIICPSLFNMKVFKDAGISIPMHHVPHCIDTQLWHPAIEPQEKRDRFTFLYFGTWKKRKGWQQLIEAFFKEFDKNDNVQLLLKTDRIIYSQRDIANFKTSLGLSKKETAPIIYETRVLTELELPRFIKSVDCLVSPTMGEGFGLPGLQSLALEVPIIITNYSGCCDYATHETATLLEPEGFILVNDMDQISQFRNRKWAHVSPESVGKAMRQVLSNYKDAKAKAKVGAAFVATNYNYNATVSRFDRIIESLS